MFRKKVILRELHHFKYRKIGQYWQALRALLFPLELNQRDAASSEPYPPKASP